MHELKERKGNRERKREREEKIMSEKFQNKNRF